MFVLNNNNRHHYNHNECGHIQFCRITPGILAQKDFFLFITEGKYEMTALSEFDLIGPLFGGWAVGTSREMLQVNISIP